MVANLRERRSIDRTRLIAHLRVFDGHSDGLIGYVADISIKGMRIVGQASISADMRFRLWMELPAGERQRERVHLVAESRWCEPSETPSFYDTGFRLIGPSARIVRRIQDIVHDFAMQAP